MVKRLILFFLVCISLAIVNNAQAQIRFYAQYSSIPFSESSSKNFNILTGIKLDPNKELVAGIGIGGRFVPEKFDGDLRYSQSSFSLAFNYYQTRRLYYSIDVSFILLNEVINTLFTKPFDLNEESYFNYQININYVVLRRLHFSTGMGAVDFSKLLAETGNNLLESNKIELNLSLSLKLYLFQIKL